MAWIFYRAVSSSIPKVPVVGHGAATGNRTLILEINGCTLTFVVHPEFHCRDFIYLNGYGCIFYNIPRFASCNKPDSISARLGVLVDRVIYVRTVIIPKIPCKG